MIKTVVLEKKVYTQLIPREIWYGERTWFVKYIAENGNAVCTVNGESVLPSDGNDLYRKLKAKGATCISREVTYESDKEIIERFERGIDKYTAYIDNYEQQKRAERNNKRLRGLISEFKQISQQYWSAHREERRSVKMIYLGIAAAMIFYYFFG